jgi:hypothetical protein
MLAIHHLALVGLAAVGTVSTAARVDVDEVGHASIRRLVRTPWPIQQDREALMLERDVALTAGATLLVDVAEADVDVRSSTADGARVRVFVSARDLDWGRTVFEDMRFTVEQSGNTLEVRARDPQIRYDRWHRNRGVGVRVEISLPRASTLDLRTSDGDIRVGDVDGDVRAESADGDIALGSVNASTIEVHTMDGDIWVRRAVAARASISTQDGDVVVQSSRGDLGVRTSDGDIRVRLEDAAEVTLTTHDGDITISMERSLRADVELEGEDVVVGGGLELVGRITRRGALGTLNGGGPRLVAATQDGTITLRAP